MKNISLNELLDICNSAKEVVKVEIEKVEKRTDLSDFAQHEKITFCKGKIYAIDAFISATEEMFGKEEAD